MNQFAVISIDVSRSPRSREDVLREVNELVLRGIQSYVEGGSSERDAVREFLAFFRSRYDRATRSRGLDEAIKKVIRDNYQAPPQVNCAA